MANLVDIARQVSTELGRPELVSNWAAGTYTPTATFLRIINSAVKRLERLVDYHAEFRRISVDVEEGDYFINIPKELQYIDAIDIEDAATRYTLEQKSEQWMRENYDEPFTLVDEGIPAYWSRWAGQGVRFENAVSNGNFDVNVDGWTPSTGSVSWSSGKARVTAGVSSIGDMMQTLPDLDLRGYRLNFSATRTSASHNFWASLWNGSDQIILYPTNTDGLIDLDSKMEYLVEQGIYTQAEVDSVIQACDKIVFHANGGVSITVDFDNISLTTPRSSNGNLLIMPPADAAYTMNIRARVYADYFVNDADNTWWSNRHPDLLVTMVKRQIALELNRNATEVAEYDKELQIQLFEIERAQAAEDQAGEPYTARMGYGS